MSEVVDLRDALVHRLTRKRDAALTALRGLVMDALPWNWDDGEDPEQETAWRRAFGVLGQMPGEPADAAPVDLRWARMLRAHGGAAPPYPGAAVAFGGRAATVLAVDRNRALLRLSTGARLWADLDALEEPPA